MTRTLPLAIVTVLTAASCADDAPSGNPPVLWLALDGSETMVRLVAFEPSPF